MGILEFEGERDEQVEERNEIEKQTGRTGKGNKQGNFTLDLCLQRSGREKVGPAPELARRIDHISLKGAGVDMDENDVIILAEEVVHSPL